MVRRREEFPAETDEVIPWTRPMNLIESRYPKKGRSRHPLGLKKMLPIYLFRQ